jgi:hypothetical protein
LLEREAVDEASLLVDFKAYIITIEHVLPQKHRLVPKHLQDLLARFYSGLALAVLVRVELEVRVDMLLLFLWHFALVDEKADEVLHSHRLEQAVVSVG